MVTISALRMTGQGPSRHDRGMDLPAPIAWLVDEAASPGPDRFLAELGGRLLSDGLPLTGGALTLAVPHPIIARRTWLWRAETGAVIEALGFAGSTLGQAGRDWLAGLGPVQEDTVDSGPDSPVLGWAGTRPFGPTETGRLAEVARFGAAPLAALAARTALTALLEAYLGRRSAARAWSNYFSEGADGPLRRGDCGRVNCFPCASHEASRQSEVATALLKPRSDPLSVYQRAPYQSSLRSRRRLGAQQTSVLQVDPERYRDGTRKAFDVAGDLGGCDGADHDRGNDGVCERELDGDVSKRAAVRAADLFDATHALEDLG